MSHGYGIDYGMGQANIDRGTGIRFGVVPLHALGEWAIGDFEADYGPATCPKCGSGAVEYDGGAQGEYGQYTHAEWDGYTGHGCCDYVCEACRHTLGSADCFGEEPVGNNLDNSGYKATLDSGGDIYILRSPFYTHAQFCSPCAPGACHLLNPTDKGGPKAYCFGHDWFGGAKAPYPVYRVGTGELVEPGEASS